jgi:hypothetical protein
LVFKPDVQALIPVVLSLVHVHPPSFFHFAFCSVFSANFNGSLEGRKLKQTDRQTDEWNFPTKWKTCLMQMMQRSGCTFCRQERNRRKKIVKVHCWHISIWWPTLKTKPLKNFIFLPLLGKLHLNLSFKLKYEFSVGKFYCKVDIVTLWKNKWHQSTIL